MIGDEEPKVPEAARRARGAGLNMAGRFERSRQRRGRRRLGHRRRGSPRQDRGRDRAPAHDHRPQRQPRRPLRPLDQPLPRLRARLHLLLRPADPRLPGPLARARLRDQAVSPSPTRPSCCEPELVAAAATAAADRAWAPTPTPTSRSSASSASRARMLEVLARLPPSGRHHHQVGADRARHRHPRRRWPSAGLARSALSITTLDREARAHDGAAAPPPARRLRGDPRGWPRPASRCG